MDDIIQERPNEDPILNFNKSRHRKSLSKKFGTQIEKSMVFKIVKNKKCLISRNKIVSGNSSWGKKSKYFPKVKAVIIFCPQARK